MASSRRDPLVESPSKLFAAVLGLTAFAVAVITGLASGADPAATIRRALVSMMLCYTLGAVLGLIAGRAVREYLEAYRAEHIPLSMDEALAMYTVEEDSKA